MGGFTIERRNLQRKETQKSSTKLVDSRLPFFLGVKLDKFNQVNIDLGDDNRKKYAKKTKVLLTLSQVVELTPGL